jgi:nucleoside-diphosphate-sugar epimerase
MIEIVNKIKNLGSESQINMIEQSKFHKMVQVKSMYMDNSRLVSLGYKPEYTIDKIVEELFNL